MLTSTLMLILSLSVILYACHIFTNGIEWFGNKLNLCSGAVGSVLAAVGTALPETVIPIIAILAYNNAESDQIGIGAIAGAPFMLVTLALFITGLSVVIYALLGKRTLKMEADVKIFSRDLTFFIAIYGVAVATTFVHENIIIKSVVAVILVLSYFVYLKYTFAGSEETAATCEVTENLLLSKLFKVDTNLFWIVTQCIISLILIVFAAHTFVHNVEKISHYMGIAPLILSIIIIPIATELPEKFNSIIWIGKQKDTLALGNIAGAMVFQSSVPVVFGLLFTQWDLTGVTMVSAVLALTAAIANLVWLKVKRTINPFMLMSGGLLYLVFILYIFV